MKEVKIILPGTPPSTNGIYKATCKGRFAKVYMTKEGKEKKRIYSDISEFSRKGVFYEDDILEMTVNLYFGDKRRRDVDNYGKILLDSMNSVVYRDDKQIKKLITEKFYDKERPRTEVFIKNIGQEGQ